MFSSITPMQASSPSGPQSIRVLTADDHPIVLVGLRALVSRSSDIHIVAEATNCSEVVSRTGLLQPDVVLLDLKMPCQTDIFDLIRRITPANGRKPVLIMSSYADDDSILAAFQAGAVGYLLKEISELELTEAIRAVYAGQRVLHPSIASRMIHKLRASS